MSLNAATIEILIAKGLSASDILEVAKATEVKKDPTNAERQARHRARKRNAVTVTPAPLNDIYSNPPEPLSAKADNAPFVENVREAWGKVATANGLDQVRKIAGARLKHLLSRRREHGEDAVFEAIAKLGESDWHCGRSSEWKADFNWLFGSPRNFEKILERSGPATQPITAEQREAYQARLAELDRKLGRDSDGFSKRGPPKPIAACLPKEMREFQAKQ